MSAGVQVDERRRREKEESQSRGSQHRATDAHQGSGYWSNPTFVEQWKQRERVRSGGCCYKDEEARGGSRGWCDRILHGGRGVEAVSYSRLDAEGTQWSEHAPIYGVYDLYAS